jgi:hypothetical protein
MNYPMHPVINIEHLKRYHESPEVFGERNQLDPPRSFLDATEEFEVEAIVGHRYNKAKRRREYRVRWMGYDPTDDSWQTCYDLRNAHELRSTYDRLYNLT